MKLKSLLATTLAVAGVAQVASAIPFPASFGLYLYDTATGASKYVAIVGGTAAYNGAVGDWSVAISTGVTVTGGGNPAIDLDVAQATAGAGATTLQVFYSDGGFGPSSGQFVLNTFLGTGGPVTTTGYLSAANTAFGQTTVLGGGADVAGANTINASGSIGSVGAPFSLTIGDVISGNVVSMDSKLSVPDGGATVMLLGMALSGVALLKRKFTA